MAFCCYPACLHNKLRAEVNRLQEENNELSRQNKKLEETSNKLKETEGKLQEISELQGRSVDELVEQVKEFKKIQEQVKASLEAQVMQNLMSVVFRADRDQDFLIDPEEVAGLKLRMKQIEGVDFSEDNLNKALAKTGVDPETIEKDGIDVKAVMEVIKNLFDDSVPEEDNIFTIKTDQVLAKTS